MKKSERIILIDADVISHFLTGGCILILPTIYPFPMKVLTQVYAELERFPKRRREVDNLLNLKLIEKMHFPEENSQIKKEYFRLIKERGKGESACMAVARFNKHILASSNLRDIRQYCEANSIVYLTTMDFLCEALHTGKMSLAACDEFIKLVKAARGKLPVDKMKDFRCRKISLSPDALTPL